MLADCAIKKLESHSWPGNVRELDNVLQRATVMCTDLEITGADILFDRNTIAPAQPKLDLATETGHV
jgi:two-component system response regulator FlrC